MYYSVMPLQGQEHRTLQDKQENQYRKLSFKVFYLLGNERQEDSLTGALQFLSNHSN